MTPPSPTRSALMSRIRGKDTTPERRVRSLLHRAGLRYRLQRRVEGVRVDMAFVSARVALFIDGCFWHGCPEHYVRPRSRTEFWDGKLAENVSRDERQSRKLRDAGWNVIRVWEHEAFEVPDDVLRRVRAAMDAQSAPAAHWRVAKVEAANEDGSEEKRLLIDLTGREPTHWIHRKRTTKKWKRPTPARNTKSRRAP